MRLSDFLKHPIVVIIFAVSYFFILQSTIGKSNLQTEIRGAYKELQNIADDLSKTDEPGKVKDVISNFSNQVVEGFKSGFQSGNKEDLIEFDKAKQRIVIKNTGKGPSSWKTKEKFIGILENNSSFPISTIKVNISCFSKEGKLIDSVNKWISEIKLLNPDESVSISRYPAGCVFRRAAGLGRSGCINGRGSAPARRRIDTGARRILRPRGPAAT